MSQNSSRNSIKPTTQFTKNHHDVCRRSHDSEIPRSPPHLGFDGPGLEPTEGRQHDMTVNMTWHRLKTRLGVWGSRLDAKWMSIFFEDTWTILAPFLDHLSKIAFHYSAESRHIVGHGTTTKMSTRPQVFPTKLCLTKPQNF